MREDDEVRAILVGVTTAHVSELPHDPVFRVHGAGETRYLRTAVGDIYENGSWSQTPPVEIPFRHNSHVQRLVDRELPTYLGNDPDQNLHSETASLAWPVNAIQSWGGLDRITVAPASASGLIPAGVWPISLNPIYIFSPGSYRPFSATFRSETSRPEYSWSAKKSGFTSEQMTQAKPVGDDYFTQLPDNLPSRVRQLAGDVTAGHATPYLKAKAIEAFLREYYSYGFADPDSPQPPIDRDPVDWFLFEQRRGTCAQFSSAFVVLARAAGIPARVVSGWVVSPQDDWQTYTRTRLTSGMRLRSMTWGGLPLSPLRRTEPRPGLWNPVSPLRVVLRLAAKTRRSNPRGCSLRLSTLHNGRPKPVWGFPSMSVAG